jgi:putative CocE/NonD family hydrolase
MTFVRVSVFVAAVLAALCVPCTAAVAAALSAAQQLPYDGFARTSLYVPGWDGTRLAVDTYRPTRAGKIPTARLPVIFLQMRSAVRRMAKGSAGAPPMLKPFLDRGYVMVLQDRRGEGASFGVQKGFVTRDDARDAAAVIDWAGSQPWSTGKVGAMGCSNQGAYQIPVAAEHPKHLVAIAPECASPFFYDTMISPNGVSAFAMGNAPPYAGDCDVVPQPGEPVDADNKPGAPLARAAAEEHRCNAKFLGQYVANMHRDTKNAYLDYPPGENDSVVGRWQAVKSSGVRIYHIGGWFDASPGGQLQAWQIWGERALIGPWTHCGTDDPGAGFAAASVDRAQDQLRWFDYTLKGIDHGIGSEPPVRFYTMHAGAGNEWHNAPRWPLPDQQPTRFYFGSSNSGSIASLNDGALTRSSDATETADRYQPDYSTALFDGKYSELRRIWDGDMAFTDRKAVTYTLATLTTDLQVTGHPVADLWVTSTSGDEDFFVILEDVGADGRSTYVTDGKIRASRRKLATPSWGNMGTPWHAQLTADDQPLSATDPAELLFDFTPTSWVFQAGHRLRVTILNAAGKTFQIPASWDRTKPRTIAIYRGGSHASSIVLPLIPAGSPFFAGRGTATL